MRPDKLDRTDPAGAIAAAAQRCSNWGRWGADDVLGTLNFLDEAKRREGAALVRRGVSFSLAQPFDMDGPQKGWRRRTNPVHTMLDTGTDAERGGQGFPHGFGGADDVVFMPLQASTQWDGLGHVFDHGMAWNGRRAGAVVTAAGDRVTGIETAAASIVGRGVLLDVGRAMGTDGELSDGFAITVEHLEATIAAQGESARVGRGDLVCVRTGRLSRARREGWGDYAGGDSPACRSPPPTGCTTPRSPGSPPTPGASRSGRTSSTTRSSRCTRCAFPTWACSSARCGTSTLWRPTAPRTGCGTSSSAPRRCPSPVPSAPRSTRSP
ncbi:cyclase family protein [Actinomadura keratinilytica]|uniref:cyclase family protein n=1 Tax=Actinomadura keratinilytica TaxID=547461 RepID=UPI0036092258